MCSRDSNVPDGRPWWFVKSDGTSAGDSINDALAVVASSLGAILTHAHLSRHNVKHTWHIGTGHIWKSLQSVPLKLCETQRT